MATHRFIFTAASAPSHDAVQLSELQVFNSFGRGIAVVDANNPGGSRESIRQTAAAAIDGDLSTKWIDVAFHGGGRDTPATTASVFELTLPEEQAEDVLSCERHARRALQA